MIMTAVLLVTGFLTGKNNYAMLFSSAISEGIRDVFKEMGYGASGGDKNENVKNEIAFKSDPLLEQK